MENDEANKAKEAIYNRDTNAATDADKATAKLAQNGPYEGSKVHMVRRQVLTITNTITILLLRFCYYYY